MSEGVGERAGRRRDAQERRRQDKKRAPGNAHRKAERLQYKLDTHARYLGRQRWFMSREKWDSPSVYQRLRPWKLVIPKVIEAMHYWKETGAEEDVFSELD